MLFDLPPVCLTVHMGPLCLDLGPGLPFGVQRVSRRLGFVAVGLAALSWDFR